MKLRNTTPVMSDARIFNVVSEAIHDGHAHALKYISPKMDMDTIQGLLSYQLYFSVENGVIHIFREKK